MSKKRIILSAEQKRELCEIKEKELTIFNV